MVGITFVSACIVGVVANEALPRFLRRFRFFRRLRFFLPLLIVAVVASSTALSLLSSSSLLLSSSSSTVIVVVVVDTVVSFSIVVVDNKTLLVVVGDWSDVMLVDNTFGATRLWWLPNRPFRCFHNGLVTALGLWTLSFIVVLQSSSSSESVSNFHR